MASDFTPTVGTVLRKDLLLKKEKIIFRNVKRHIRQGQRVHQDKVTHRIVSEAVNGWNWGAFAVTGMWGICHKVCLTLLVLVPISL